VLASSANSRTHQAIAGWPLGDTARHSDAVMTNLIGADVERWRELAGEDLALHLYGKAEARAGRKMGHTTRLCRRVDDSSRDAPYRLRLELMTPTLWTIGGAFVRAVPDWGLLALVGWLLPLPNSSTLKRR
jgi:hypothetical protein